jgi:hypothetical protein
MILALLTMGCADSLTVAAEGEKARTLESVGLFNTRNKASDVCYDIVVGNVVWSILLIETLVAPIYFVGFSIMEPVGLKVNEVNPEGCW